MKDKTNQSHIKAEVYDKLPEELKKLTASFEGRERDIALLSSIGVFSNGLPNIRGVYMGNIVYPHLYIMVLAPPASGKGVLGYSRLLIDKIDDNILYESRKRQEEYLKDKKKSKESYNCPEIEAKILPANISSAEMYRFFNTSKHGLLIHESEADTLSAMFKSEWGNYSDVLRKAFHHEPLTLSRKTDKQFLKIKTPKLALVLSGTPDQLKPVIKSRENGLFSRFLIYSFSDVSVFRNPFEKLEKQGKETFMELGKKWVEIYNSLENLPQAIEFRLTEEQVEKFMHDIPSIRENVIEKDFDTFVACVHRHGLILFRIAMVLTALRNIKTMHQQKELLCTNADFEIALSITKTSLIHSFHIYNMFGSSSLSIEDYEILRTLTSPKFTTKEAYEKGKEFGMKKRTMIDKLSQWSKKGFIKSFSYGLYEKRIV